MANIQSNLNKIKNAVLGVDVRDSIHDGIKAINEEVENTTDRQVQLEGTFDELVINAGNSNAEVAAARVDSTGKSHGTLGKRLNNFDSQIKEKANIKDYNVNVKMFGAKGDGLTNDTKAIYDALNYAYENNKNLYIPAGEYMVDSNLTTKEDWEIFAPVFQLQDKKILIYGDGESTILRKIKNDNNAIAMFRTCFNSENKVHIKDLKIVGNMNAGSNGNLIDGICVNGSNNGVFENIYINGTKRHGFYLIHNAKYNKILNPVIRNTSREMSGCGIQLEGASYNTIKNVDIRKTGSNAIDFNTWFTSLYYPRGKYQADKTYNSVGNEVIGGILKDIALENQSEGGGIATNFVDDDYYGVNIINNSNFNYVSLDFIENVRIVDDPAKFTYQCVIRLYNCSHNEVFIKDVKNIKKYICRLGENTTLNTVVIDKCNYYSKVLDIDLGYNGNVFNNDIRIFSNGNKQTDETVEGYELKNICNSTNSTSTDYRKDILDKWGVSWGTILSVPSSSVLRVMHESTQKFITKNMSFSNPFLMLKMKYRTNSSTAAIGFVGNGIYHEHKVNKGLVADEITHQISILIPKLSDTQSLRISANNSDTINKNAYIEISELELFDNLGNKINKTSKMPKLLNYPTIGIYNKGDIIYNSSVNESNSIGWVCIESGSPGTWREI